MMAIAGIFLLIFTNSIYVCGSEVDLKRNNQLLKAKITNIELPLSTLEKTLPSGISNNILIKLSLIENNQIVMGTVSHVKVVYDLWHEVYRLTITEHNAESIKIIKKTKKEVFDFLLSHESKIGDLKNINPNGKYSLKFEWVLDPIDKEKQVKIKRWLAQNRVSVSSISNRLEGGGIEQVGTIESKSGPSTSGIFNSLLENELLKESTQGSFKTEFVKQNISLSEIQNEK